MTLSRISEPQWIDNVPSQTRCSACIATIAKGGRYLTDRYSRNKAICLCKQCAQTAIEALSKRRMNHNKEIQRHPNCPQCHASYPLTVTKAPVNQHALAVLLVNLARPAYPASR